MARFESGWQVFVFLLGAALFSVAVIEVLKVEAAKRYGDDDAVVSVTSEVEVADRAAPEIRRIRETEQDEAKEGEEDSIQERAVDWEARFRKIFWKMVEKLKEKLRESIFRGKRENESAENQGAGSRKKRSVSALQSRRPFNPPVIPDEGSPYPVDRPFIPDVESPYPVDQPDGKHQLNRADDVRQAPRIEIEAVVSDPKVAAKSARRSSQDMDERHLAENLAIESLRGHRVRNLKRKVAKLNPYDPIVAEILKKFCQKEVDRDDDDNVDNSHDEVVTVEEEEDPIADMMEESVVRYPPFLDNKDEAEPTFEGGLEVEEEDFRFVCQSYGDLYLTVVVTTVVNFSVLGLVLICRSAVKAHRRSKRNARFFVNNIDEQIGSDIFKTNTSEYSPIIKCMADDSKI